MTPLEHSYLYFPQSTRLALEADAMLRRFEYEYEALTRQFASSDSSPDGSLSSTPQEDVSSRPFRLIDETAVPDYLDSRLSRIVSPSAMASGSSSFNEEWPSSDEGEESFDGWESSSAEDEVPASTRKRKQARKTKCKHARSPRVQRTARRSKTTTKAASTPVVAPPAEPAALPRKRKRTTVPQPQGSPAASCSGTKRRRQPATLASAAEEEEDDTDEILECLGQHVRFGDQQRRSGDTSTRRICPRGWCTSKDR